MICNLKMDLIETMQREMLFEVFNDFHNPRVVIKHEVVGLKGETSKCRKESKILKKKKKGVIDVEINVPRN